MIKGAREHNLKNISLEIPKGKLVVFTGISGSGKSSLAFDTIYAEGQRRYVESLSTYARQFLGVMEKPDVQSIDGLSPSISIDQKNVSHNPRSTVGTITEIYDYLRVLYAKIGHPSCPNCGREIAKLSADEIVKKILGIINSYFKKDQYKPQQFKLVSPVVRDRKGEFSSLFDNLRAKGFQNLIIDGQPYTMDKEIALIKTNKHTIKVVIDQFSLNNKNFTAPVFKANLKSRLFASVEQSLNLSDGLVILYFSSNKGYLFSEKFSCPQCNVSLPEIEPRMFSFNSPLGACPKCRGLGSITKISPELVFNDKFSISEGGILPYKKIYYQDTWFVRLFKTFLDDLNVDSQRPIAQLTDNQRRSLLYGKNKMYRVRGLNRFGRETHIFERFNGIIGELESKYHQSSSEYLRREIEKYMVEETCDQCQGKRLKKEVLGIKVEQRDIFSLSNISVEQLYNFFEHIEKKGGILTKYEKNVAAAIIIEIKKRLKFLTDVGLNYLTLNRPAKTLACGEAQRIRLASQIGSGLTGVTYVLDEPSIGLHPKDINALILTLKNLRNLGNTVIVVEHDPETIKAADQVIDFGPLAADQGGKIVFQGPVDKLKKDKNSITGKYLSGRLAIKRRKESKQNQSVDGSSRLVISGCRQHNLKNLTVYFPLSCLIGVTGVSGSGKSTLVVETLYPALKYYVEARCKEQIGKFDHLEGYQYLDKVYLVDQSSIGKTPRSNPATYVGAFDYIREVFAETVDARARGYQKGRFSFNVKGGRCEKCVGGGIIKIEMQFLPDVYVKCDVCQERRYNSETLEIRYKGKNIHDVLNLTVDEAIEFFSHQPKILRKLKALQDVGLGYIRLGQSAPSLSGGEAQRVKLANELSKKETGRTLYILDEPTVGLHPFDIEKLINTLYQLIERGNTVIIIEHNLDVIKNCQFIIDLGPEGGEKGGEVIFQGLIDQILEVESSHTRHFLKQCLD